MGVRIVLFGLLAASAAAFGEGVDERVERLEERNREILERLEASERRNEELGREVEELRGQGRDLLEREVDEYLRVTDEIAGGDASGARTKAGAFVTLYGFIRLDAYYNTARFNSVIVPFWVLPDSGGEDDQFALDARLTRIGLLFDFGQVGDAGVTGRIETDFANFPSGVPESRETPRIRVAYIQVETARWRLRLGQDWDVISPLYPNINHEGVMWNAGNLGDRRPMIRWLWKGGAVDIEAALGLTGAIDNQDLDGGGAGSERDGFDAGKPHVQVRVSAEPGEATVGVWAFVGELETDTAFAGENDFVSWVGGADFVLPLTARLVLRGEVWYGAALADVRGNIGQAINTALGEEIEGWGGWIEVVFERNESWTFYGGGTLDDPSDGDVPAGGRERNFTAYVGVRRHWSKTLRSTFDVIFWETAHGGAGVGNAIRFNFWTSVDF